MMRRLLKTNFLVLCRFVSPAAIPFALVLPLCCVRTDVRTDSDVITKTKVSRMDGLAHFRGVIGLQ